jgi:phosphatidylglycerol lysyltransferase
LRCTTAVKGDSWVARGGLAICWHALNSIFDFQGVYHFKSRFRPEYRELYLVTRPKATVGSMVALGIQWGLFGLSPWRLARHYGERLFKRGSRKSLAVPDPHPERVLRRLLPKPEPSGPRTAASASAAEKLSAGRL